MTTKAFIAFKVVGGWVLNSKATYTRFFFSNKMTRLHLLRSVAEKNAYNKAHFLNECN
jgi:hypothetical protein